MSSALLWSGSTIALFAAAVVAQPAGPLPATATTAAAQIAQALAPSVAVAPVQPAYDPLRLAIDQWDLLRRDGPASFDEIYRFLMVHPGWPAETTLRQRAERLMT